MPTQTDTIPTDWEQRAETTHQRATFGLEDGDGQSVPMDIVEHRKRSGWSWTLRVWDPTVAQPFVVRPYSPNYCLFEATFESQETMLHVANEIVAYLDDRTVDAMTSFELDQLAIDTA